MKKLFVILSILLMTVMLFGCGDVDNSSPTQNVLPPQEFNRTWTLQGKIMDATTGAALGSDTGSELKMYLIQGDNDRGPSKLHAGATDPLRGEYSFSGIPADAVHAGGAIYKVIVTKPGYQDFSAYVNFDATTVGGGIFDYDAAMNMIGNIYLFPIGSVPGTLHVHVTTQQLVPVPGVTVLLQQNIAANTATAIVDAGNRLAAAGGLYPSMSATTDADGVATFSGTDLTLVLGGSYIAKALAIEFQGTELATTATPGAFIIGTNTLHQNISMAVAGPASFFATSATNQIPGTITPTGVLAITFNQPILLTTTTCLADITGGGIITSGTTTGSVDMPVDAVLSADSLTLTLTPNITTAPTGTGAFITYHDCGTIILKNTQQAPADNTLFIVPDPGTNVTNVNNSSQPVSGEVQLTSF